MCGWRAMPGASAYAGSTKPLSTSVNSRKSGFRSSAWANCRIRSSVRGSTTPITMLLCFSMTWSSVSGLRGSPLACVVSAASVQGFSLPANTQVPAHRRDQLERLIRYTARGAVSLERLTQDAHGELVYTFTYPWSDGTTGIRLSPLELLEKLAALVPLPRMHLVRYGGCLAPHSH